jgi:hypothetical protein
METFTTNKFVVESVMPNLRKESAIWCIVSDVREKHIARLCNLETHIVGGAQGEDDFRMDVTRLETPIEIIINRSEGGRKDMGS